jgi:type IV secretory pathway VirB10-like protein
MKKITATSLAALALALVACGEEKAAPDARPEPIAKVDQAASPAQPAPPPEPAKPAAPPPSASNATGPAAPSAGVGAAPEVAKIELAGAKKGPVTFPHALHVGFPIVGGKCNGCHHTSDEKGADAAKCTAAGCHDGNGKVAPKDAFHDLCRGCHSKALGEQPDNEKLKKLKSCKGCHVG